MTEMHTPAALKLARKIAYAIMRGPAETCETRQQFLNGAVPIIATALDELPMTDPTSYAAAIEAAARVVDEWAKELPRGGMYEPVADDIRTLAPERGGGSEPAPESGEDSPTVPREWVTHWQTKCQATATLLKATEARIRELEGEVARWKRNHDDIGRQWQDEAAEIGPRLDRLTTAAQVAWDALEPFARAGGCEVVRPDDHPLRESNRVETIIWSYHDSRNDADYRLTVPDLRRAREARASLASALDGGEG